MITLEDRVYHDRCPTGDPWAKWEDEFLLSTYTSRKWTPAQIAEKLERTRLSIYGRANELGLKRPKLKLNYKKIDRLHKKGMSAEQIAKIVGCSSSGVHVAVKRMAGGLRP